MNSSLASLPDQGEISNNQSNRLKEILGKGRTFFMDHQLAKVVRKVFGLESQIWDTFNQLLIFLSLHEMRPEGMDMIVPRAINDLWLELAREEQLYAAFCTAVFGKFLSMPEGQSLFGGWLSQFDAVQRFTKNQFFLQSWCWRDEFYHPHAGAAAA